MSFVSSALTRCGNLETHSLLWLDGSVNSNENRNAQQQLRSAVNYIRVFESSIECETYIHESKNDQILLIVSGQLGSVIVPLIHSLRQIDSIYVYCSNPSKHQKWASKFVKILAVAADLNEIIEKINADRKGIEKPNDDYLSISIFNSIPNEERSSTNINGGFLHFQLLIDGLLRLPYNQRSRDEFLNLCKDEYEGNNVELSILEEFEKDYVPENALYWYTRHSFLYRMLNKALRVQNIDVLFLFRFFIQDLYQQLRKLQQEQNQTSIRVYRSQLMSKNELDVLEKSIGQFISTNSFLSTSLDRQKSLSFVSFEHNDLCHVLFEIDVEPYLSDETKLFANISSQSEFKNEKEILFMVATIFRVINILQVNGTTVIQMKLCNENYDHDIKLLFKHMQMENEEYKCLALGRALRTAGMYDKAEQFYNRMLNELADDHPLIAHLWSSIGIVKRAKGEVEISSQWLNKSFKKYEQMENHLGLAKCLQDLGNIHHMKREFNQAIDKYNQALDKFKELLGEQNKSVADCLNNLGVIYFEQHKFTVAVRYYTDALTIRERIFPHTHPDIASTLNNIGNVCFLNNEYDRALEYFERALKILEASLPSKHPSIAKVYCNMSVIYLKKNNGQQALAFLNRAVSIYCDTFSPDHPEVHRCVEAIDRIKQKINKQGSTHPLDSLILF